MKLSASFVLLSLALASSVAAAPAAQKAKSGQTGQNGVVGAAFFMTNDPNGNFVMSSTIGADGKLINLRAIPTGGKGGHGKVAQNGPDALFSQSALKATHRHLVVVNPGSNTLTLFNLNKNDPADIKQVGKPANTQGEFPMSVAVNNKGSMACVLNGGAKNGVACFAPDSKKGLFLMKNTVRNLGLKQTTPPSGPAGSASHILFSEDGKQLIASIKGSPPDAGFLAVWDVDANGGLSQNFKAITPPKGGALPFGMAAIPNTNAFVVTDPGVGFDVIDLSQLNNGAGSSNNNNNGVKATAVAANANNNVKPTAVVATAKAARAVATSSANSTAAKAVSGAQVVNAKTEIQSLAESNVVASGKSSANKVDGQDAVCWVQHSKKTGNFYMTDIGTSKVTEASVDPQTLAAKIVRQYDLAPGSATIDDAIGTINGKDFLYVLAANATTVNVLSLNAPGQAQSIQNVSFANPAKELKLNLDPNNVQGMALFIPA